MGLISLSDYLASTRESTAVTRAKTASALDLGPDVADVFGHSTPPPWQTKRLLKKNKKDCKQNLQEKKGMRPDYSFDRLVRKAASTAGDIDKEIRKGDEEADRIDKEIEKKNKSRPDKSRDREDKKEPETDDVRSDVPNQKRPGPDQKQDHSRHAANDLTLRFNRQAYNNSGHKKREVPDVDELTEEQSWLRLLDTSFDRSQ